MFQSLFLLCSCVLLHVLPVPPTTEWLWGGLVNVQALDCHGMRFLWQFLNSSKNTLGLSVWQIATLLGKVFGAWTILSLQKFLLLKLSLYLRDSWPKWDLVMLHFFYYKRRCCQSSKCSFASVIIITLLQHSCA